jgi:hypothetical protein
MNSQTFKSLIVATGAVVGLSQASSAQVAILDLRTPWQLGTNNINPSTPGTGLGTTWVKNNIFLPGGRTVNAKITVTGVGSSASLSSGSAPLVFSGNQDTSPWITFDLELTDGSGNPTGIPNMYFTPYDIDGAPGSDMREFWGYKNPVSTPDVLPDILGTPTSLVNSVFPGGPGDMASYTTYAPSVTGTNADTGDGITIGPVQAPWAVSSHYNYFTGGSYFYGFTGSTSANSLRGMLMVGLSAPEPGTAAGSLLVGWAMIGMAARRRRK